MAEDRIQAAATGVSFLLPHVQHGKTKLLVLFSDRRSPQAPDVPTAKEAGHPELTFRSVAGFYGWRDIRPEHMDRIAADVRAVANLPSVLERITSIGAIPRSGTPEEFAAAIEEQRTRVAEIARMMQASK